MENLFKIPKKLVTFGGISAKFGQNLRNFGKKQKKIQQFLTKILRLESEKKIESGAKGSPSSPAGFDGSAVLQAGELPSSGVT